MNPTILPMTQAPMPSAPLSPDAPAARRFAVVLTTLVAGAAGCLIAYWTWRMVLRLPIAVEPGSGLPPLGDLFAAIPGIVGSAVQVTFVNLIYCGLITVPAAAFIGLLLAAGGRLMVWTVERVTHRRGDAEAD